MVAEQGSELSEERGGEAERHAAAHHQRQHVGGKKVSVVHVREEEGDTYGKQHRHGDNAAVAQAGVAKQSGKKHNAHVDERGENGDLGRGLFVRNAADERKHGGGVVVQSAAYAPGLVEIQRERLKERPAQQHGGKDEQHIAQRENEKVLPAELPIHPQHGVHRHDEHCLKLEAEGERDTHHRKHRPVVQCEIYPQHRESRIGAVALPPERAVEYHRGHEQHRKEAEEPLPVALRAFSDELHGGIGQHHVEEYAQQLDEI